jgi:signal transduction histidine kinase
MELSTEEPIWAGEGGAGQPAAPATAEHVHHHAVQFYEDESYLATVVGEFLADGLKAGQPVVVVATPGHRGAFVRQLGELGIDVAAARRSGQFQLLDARETLAKFTIGNERNADRFNSTIGSVIARGLRGREGTAVRAYGEMVDLLWKDGDTEGAIQVERLWNALAKQHHFALLCAYSMGSFCHASDADAFLRVCDEHSHVLPTESYSTLNDRAKLLEISRLQQRARALEAEVAERERVEQRLREAVIALNQREREAEEARAAAEEARSVAEEARAIAEHANRAKSEFLAVMSHELRTPLNAIGGYTELLEMGVHGEVSAAQREAFERIQRSQRLLLGLINQVLNYARIETGTVRYNLGSVSVGAALRSAEALMGPQLRAKAMRFETTGATDRAFVRADEERLQQILLNLLSNAVKFTDRGGLIRVDVDTTPELVRLHVSDSGIGIPREKLGVIFEPFVQVDPNYTRTHEGVGLGLAISRDLARGMGGDLTVSSIEGEGSRFTLTLPVERALQR